MSWETIADTRVDLFDIDSVQDMTAEDAHAAIAAEFERIQHLPDYNRHYYDENWHFNQRTRRLVEEHYTWKEPYELKLAMCLQDAAIFLALGGPSEIIHRDQMAFLVRFYHLPGDANMQTIQAACLKYIRYTDALRTVIEIEQDMPDGITDPAKLKTLRARWRDGSDIDDLPDTTPPPDGTLG